MVAARRPDHAGDLSCRRGQRTRLLHTRKRHHGAAQRGGVRDIVRRRATQVHDQLEQSARLVLADVSLLGSGAAFVGGDRGPRPGRHQTGADVDRGAPRGSGIRLGGCQPHPLGAHQPRGECAEVHAAGRACDRTRHAGRPVRAHRCGGHRDRSLSHRTTPAVHAVLPHHRGANAHRGTGLAIAIAASIVELHGGKIWCESDGKSGSTFSFTLPCRPLADGGQPERAAGSMSRSGR